MMFILNIYVVLIDMLFECCFKVIGKLLFDFLKIMVVYIIIYKEVFYCLLD